MDVKIPLYNILNMFLTGFVFLAGIITLYPVTLIEVVTGEVFIKLSTVPEIVLLLCLIASSYEIGLILNRAGSVIIEPVLIKTKFLRFSENFSGFEPHLPYARSPGHPGTPVPSSQTAASTSRSWTHLPADIPYSFRTQRSLSAFASAMADFHRRKSPPALHAARRDNRILSLFAADPPGCFRPKEQMTAAHSD